MQIASAGPPSAADQWTVCRAQHEALAMRVHREIEDGATWSEASDDRYHDLLALGVTALANLAGDLGVETRDLLDEDGLLRGATYSGQGG